MNESMYPRLSQLVEPTDPDHLALQILRLDAYTQSVGELVWLNGRIVVLLFVESEDLSYFDFKTQTRGWARRHQFGPPVLESPATRGCIAEVLREAIMRPGQHCPPSVSTAYFAVESLYRKEVPK